MSQATYSSEGYADADLVARLRAGDEAAVAAPDELAQGTHRGPIRTVERLMRWPVMAYPSISAVRADAVFVSGLQRCDEPSACEVRQAAAAAIRAFGCSGCAGRVAQEFGDHPETAVIRMRWARGVVVEAFADPPRRGDSRQPIEERTGVSHVSAKSLASPGRLQEALPL